MVATIVCELDVGEGEVVWACACLCTGPPVGAEAVPLHNPNPTSPNPNLKKFLGFMLKFLAQIWPPNFFTSHL